jgi:hypothetical protein
MTFQTDAVLSGTKQPDTSSHYDAFLSSVGFSLRLK